MNSTFKLVAVARTRVASFLVAGFFLVLAGCSEKNAATDMVANVSADKQSVTMTFTSTPPVSITWSTADLQKTIENLGKVREIMQPEVPNQPFPLGQVVPDARNPTWSVEPIRGESDSLLHLRHPSYGWLHFFLPNSEARKLGDELVAESKSRSL
jgi:hypothetical protein